MYKNSDLGLSEKVEHADRSVPTGVIVEEMPLYTLIQFWTNSSDALQQPFQNSLVNFRVDCLTLGYKFMIDQALTVKKGDQHYLNL